MADEGKPRFEIPWATLLPLVAALAGVIAQFRPLVSARPSIPNTRPLGVIAQQDVDARMWQDPLAVAQKAKEQMDADALARGVSERQVDRHKLATLKQMIEDAATARAGKVLLFAVMLDSGPNIEQAESRLRLRQAVLEGLNESGFVPVDSEHIGYVIIPGEESPKWQSDDPKKTLPDGFTLIPWEEERPEDLNKVFPAGTRSAFVLWLPSAGFNGKPLHSLAELLKDFSPAAREQMEIRFLGPVNSTGLGHMLEEANVTDLTPFAPLGGVKIFSPLATAPAEAFGVGERELRATIEGCVPAGAAHGLEFQRTISTDERTLHALIDELREREIFAAPHETKKGWVDGDHIVILTEWDTPYARSLASTFVDQARPDKRDQGAVSRIDWYRYMHGIDGRLPGDAAKAPDGSQKSSTGPAAAAMEATEGLDQSDYLRRLAGQLKDEDERSGRKTQGRIRAIGLLGSDLFDKLMILRALRPEFPDAIFFTNNYDAHFERRDDWSDVRNLVVASPFGSRLELPNFVQPVAPFRDNNQTSMFFGTLVATGKVHQQILENEIHRQPRIYEVGRRGFQELFREPSTDSSGSGPMAVPHWFRDWLRQPRVIGPLAIAALALFLMTAWISLSIVNRNAAGGGNLRDRLKRVCGSTSFLLICGVPIIVVAVGLFAQSGKAIEEPLAFFSGISIWPSEMLRLIALMLAIHFLLKARIDLRANEREITRQFFPEAKISDTWRFDLGLRRWQKEHPTWVTGGAKFPAAKAWSAYLCRNSFWPRFVRVGALTLMYFAFSLGIFVLFPAVATPARGEVAFITDRCILFPAIVAMMILTFYVVDAIRLNSNFIRILTRNVTEWEAPVTLGSGRVPPLDEKDLPRYYNISFVARRTEAVAPLIWYPLIVLAIVFLARSSVFDHWTWPISLIVIFTLNATWAFGSAMFLRRSAEQLRSAVINDLQFERLKSYDQPVRRTAFDELIAEVRGMRKGAFAPLSEQPFIRAIIYPSGGIGLLAVAQRLLDIF